MSAPSYRRLLALPGARAFFIPGLIARFGISMLALAILWAVHGVSGSFATAGLTTGAFAATEALLAPQVARLVDARGQRAVVSIQVGAFAIAAAGLLLGLFLAAPSWSIVAAAGVLGVACPQVGSMTIARWRYLIARPEQMPPALALEGVVNSAGYMVAPIVVTTVATTVNSVLPLLIGVLMVTGGTVALVLRRDSEPAPARAGKGLVIDSRLLARPFLTLSGVHACLGFYFGGTAICLTAVAFERGFATWAGAVGAGGAGLSLLFGLAYGSLSARTRPTTVMICAGISITAAFGALVTQPPTPVVIALLILAGGCVAAIAIPSGVVLQRTTAEGVYVQAITWTGSTSALGTALAGPVIGALVQGWSWSVGALAVAVTLGGIVVASVSLRSADQSR